MKFGILGGTFDPPHNGHLHMADAAMHSLHLAQVIFIPAKQPPHKLGEAITPLSDRVAMLEQALRGRASFVISMVEANRPGPSYTVDTLRELRHDLAPSVELFFIMGMDSLVNLPTWRQPAEIVKLCKLAVVKRPGFEVDLDALEAQVPGVKQSVLILRAAALEISASEIRARVQNGESIQDLVPTGVATFIERHRLYAAR